MAVSMLGQMYSESHQIDTIVVTDLIDNQPYFYLLTLINSTSQSVQKKEET